jgi:hypothetical protein
MNKFSVIGCVFLLCIAGLVGSAQQAMPTTPPLNPPADELVQAWVEHVRTAAEFANTECQALDSVKRFNSLRQMNQVKIEARLPGFTVDWSKFIIVAKKPATPPAPAK